MSLEKTQLTLGYIPLTDCAVFAVAKEKGFFEQCGLDVTLRQEVSWANIRDKLQNDLFDAAQMLAPMVIAASLGVDGLATQPMMTAMSLDLNGNAITVSNSLYDKMRQAEPQLIHDRQLSGRALKQVQQQETLRFAVVFPYSMHNYQLRYWLASAGIDPDHDVQCVVVPPPQMVNHLAQGKIDGFCVGEPWNAHAVQQKVGHTVISGYDIWQNSPEKVLGVTQAWAERHPETHLALIKALLSTAQWMDSLDHRLEVVDILTKNHYINVSAETIRMSMTGTFQYSPETSPEAAPDYNVFYRYAANFPWRSHAKWFISQMYRWGQLDQLIDIDAAARQAYRPDIFRQAAQVLGMPVPTIDYKLESQHASPWTLEQASKPMVLGSDLFLDHKMFNADLISDYLRSFDIRHLHVDLDQLAEFAPNACQSV